MLFGVLKDLIHRVHLLWNRREDVLEELELLKHAFISNAYPEKRVLKTVKDSWTKERLKAVQVEGREKAFFDVLYAPYVKGFTEGLQRN